MTYEEFITLFFKQIMRALDDEVCLDKLDLLVALIYAQLMAAHDVRLFITGFIIKLLLYEPLFIIDIVLTFIFSIHRVYTKQLNFLEIFPILLWPFIIISDPMNPIGFISGWLAAGWLKLILNMDYGKTFFRLMFLIHVFIYHKKSDVGHINSLNGINDQALIFKQLRSFNLNYNIKYSYYNTLNGMIRQSDIKNRQSDELIYLTSHLRNNNQFFSGVIMLSMANIPVVYINQNKKIMLTSIIDTGCSITTINDSSFIDEKWGKTESILADGTKIMSSMGECQVQIDNQEIDCVVKIIPNGLCLLGMDIILRYDLRVKHFQFMITHDEIMN